MNNQIYPVNQIESKEIDTLIDPETGEILDEKAVETYLFDEKAGQKAETLINKIKLEVATVDVISQEILNFKEMKRVRENRVKNMKRFLLMMMQSWDKKKLEFDTMKATRVMNAGRLEIDMGADMSAYMIPDIKEKLDKKAVKADLDSGKKVKGCRIVKEERVDIK